MSAALTRHSSGFDQFCNFLQTSESQSILDVSGASQANVSFITGMGHRISSEDVLAVMEECFGPDFIEGQQAAAKTQRFFDQVLKFPDASFDAALVWDTLQYLNPTVIEQMVAQLFRIMRPGGAVLAFFNSDEKVTRLPVFSYRIQDRRTLIQVPRGTDQRSQYFPNRAIEKLFNKAASLKFFLTRGSSREVIVKR
jgi:SAM-dependent methyltransferase